MANLHLVTGYAGVEHITSDDQASYNAAIMGAGQFILERGKQFKAAIISNNLVRVFDGDALMQGRHIRLKENTYVDLNFDNGLQGYNRIDLIVMRYTKDSATDIETADLVVIKGTPVEGNPFVPDHIIGNLLENHDLENDLVLYKVPFIGLNIQPLEAVFNTVSTLSLDNINFDDSGEVDGINSFTDFMASYIKGTPIYQFLANLKAGLKYVLHAGQLVNNGLCEESGKFALDAAYGHELTEQITQLYSEIADGLINVRWNETSNRIEVNYNGEWVNYPPSFVGDSIYLISDGVLLVPFLISQNVYSVTETSEGVVVSTPSTSLSSSQYIGITLDKSILIDEPYELHVEAKLNSERNGRVAYSGKELKITSHTFADIYTTVNSGNGEVKLGAYSLSSTTSAVTNYTIKNLYLRRIRE